MRSGYIRISQKPKEFPNYGEGNCLYCGKELPPRRRKYCSDECGFCYRIKTADFRIMSWAVFRDKVLVRDNHVCVDCGAGAEEVHHKIPIYKGGKEFDKDNCISLCIPCHHRRHLKKQFDPHISQKGIFDLQFNSKPVMREKV